MARFDLLLRAGAAVLPGRGVQDCDIAVQDGRIAAVLAPGTPAEAAETIAIPGLVAMPGAIDAHLHLGAAGALPGRAYLVMRIARPPRPPRAESPASCLSDGDRPLRNPV